MLINFDAIAEEALPHFKGGEMELCARRSGDALNLVMRARLVPGASIGQHVHETSSEVLLVLSGAGKVVCDGVEERLTVGSCHYCPKGHSHTLVNDGAEDLVFFAVVPQQ